MSEVRIEDGESLESALKRFKKKVQKAGILTEIRRREHYEKPSVKKKRKRAQARRKKRFKSFTKRFFFLNINCFKYLPGRDLSPIST